MADNLDVYTGPISLGSIIGNSAAPTQGSPAGGVTIKSLVAAGLGLTDSYLLQLFGTATGAGATAITCTLWLWDASLTRWVRPGKDPNRGMLNGGTAIGDTDALDYVEEVTSLGAYDAVYVQATSPTNLSALVAYLRSRR